MSKLTSNDEQSMSNEELSKMMGQLVESIKSIQDKLLALKCSTTHSGLNSLSQLVMCDNDFTSLSIIMIILSRYDSYHDSTTNSKNY